MEKGSFMERLAAPARRALAAARIATVEELAARTREELAGLHGIGPNALKTLEEELAARGLAFRQE